MASALTLILETGGAFALILPGVFVDGRERASWRSAMETLACVDLSDARPRPVPAHSVTYEQIAFVAGAA